MVAYFRLKVNNNSSVGEVARISVQGGATEYGPLSLQGADFAASNQYQEFPLSFTFSPDTNNPFLIFQFWRSGNVDVYIDAVSIFTAPQPVTSPLTWTVPGKNYRGQGVWVRYTDGTQFSGISEVNVSKLFSLTVKKAGNGNGTVTSEPGGINCGSDCSEQYTDDTTVLLTASAATGSTFAGWSGACSGTGTCSVSMSAARSVTANFLIPVPSGIYDDRNNAWMYNGSFVTFASVNAYQGGIQYTTTVGDYAQLLFTGSQISLLYTGNTNRGKVDVYVDGIKVGTIDQYSSSAVFQKKWTSGDLGAGTHTVKLVHAGPAGTLINVDAVRIQTYQPPVTSGIYDDAHAAWNYYGSFVAFASLAAYQSGIHYSTTVGNYAEINFSGSQISLLYTGNTNRGKVDVYLDDTKIGTINQATASAVFQKKWTSGDLGAGTHTVKFIHAGPNGATINIDAVQVGDYQPPVVPGAGVYDDSYADWIYTGSFVPFASSSAYQGGIRYSTTVGNSAEFTFSGSQLSLLYTGNSNRGKVDVIVDGSKVGTIDQYTPAAVFQKKWTSADLGAGTHTVKFVHVGPAGATINIDAIEVLP
jgi:hypothetical protein